MGKAFGAEVKPATGRTVGEVLVDARAWKEKMKAAEAEAKKRETEAEALKAKVLGERKAIASKISSFTGLVPLKGSLLNTLNAFTSTPAG